MPDMMARVRCQVCHEWTRKSALVKQNWEWMQPAGNNLLLWSDYNSSFWTSTAVNAGLISYGPFDRHTTTLVDETWLVTGEQTWTGNGKITSSAVDVSSLSNLCFRVVAVGQSHIDYQPMTVELGYNDGTDHAQKTAVCSGDEMLWWTLPNSGLTSVSFYIKATTTGNWYFAGASLEDATCPGLFIPTSGAARQIPLPVKLSGPVTVCPRCRARRKNGSQNGV